jgi:hypothetical protein
MSHGLAPAPVADLRNRAATTCADFQHSQAEALLAVDSTHQGASNARPLATSAEPITEPGRLVHLTIHRRDRLGGVLYGYKQAA